MPLPKSGQVKQTYGMHSRSTIGCAAQGRVVDKSLVPCAGQVTAYMLQEAAKCCLYHVRTEGGKEHAY